MATDCQNIIKLKKKNFPPPRFISELNYRYVVYDTIHLYFTYKLGQLTPVLSRKSKPLLVLTDIYIRGLVKEITVLTWSLRAK